MFKDFISVLISSGYKSMISISVQQITFFINILLITNYINISVYGEATTIFYVINLVSIFCVMGFPVLIVSGKHLSNEDIGAIFKFSLVLTLLSIFVIILINFIFFSKNQFIFLSTIYLLSNLFIVFNTSILQRNLKFTELAVMNIYIAVFTLLSTSMFIKLDVPSYAIIGSPLLAQFSYLIFFRKHNLGYLHKSKKINEVSYSKSFVYTLNNVIHYFCNFSISSFLIFLFPGYLVGLYNFANLLQSRLFLLIASIHSPNNFPLLSSIETRKGKIQNSIIYLVISNSLLIPASFIIYAISDDVFKVFFNNDYYASLEYFKLLLIGSYVGKIIGSGFANLIRSEERMLLLFYISFIRVIILLIGFSFLYFTNNNNFINYVIVILMQELIGHACHIFPYLKYLHPYLTQILKYHFIIMIITFFIYFMINFIHINISSSYLSILSILTIGVGYFIFYLKYQRLVIARVNNDIS